MPSLADIQSLNTTLLWAAFGLAFAFGAIAWVSNFCTMGAVADVANFGDWTRARMVLLAMGTAVLATSLLALQGLDLSKSLYTAPKLLWLSHIVGGLCFGFGMTIASGCGSKTLLRAGGGNMKAWVTLLVMALFAAMTLRGVLASVRASALDPIALTLPTTQDLPSVLANAFGLAKPTLLIVCAIFVFAFVAVFAFKNAEFRASRVSWASGLLIGLIGAAGWWLTGRAGFIAEHPETLEAAYLTTQGNRPESFTFTAPIAQSMELLTLWSDKARVVNFGIATTLGMLLGATVAALATKSFRWESFANTEDLANHLAGGALMGFGGVTALGCTVGQGLSGFSTLAIGSFITIAAIIFGCRLALKYQMWRLE